MDFLAETARLASFVNADKKISYAWDPSSSKTKKNTKIDAANIFLSVKKLVEAGFYLNPSTRMPDRCTCYLCEASTQLPWLSEDDPFEIHAEISPNCPLVLSLYRARQWSEKFNNGQQADPEYSPSTELMFVARVKTFRNWWPHENKAGFESCSVEKVAAAGFTFYSVKPEKGDDSVRCLMCGTQLNHWEPFDDPRAEHAKRRPQCAFFEVEKKSNLSNQNLPRTRQRKFITTEKETFAEVQEKNPKKNKLERNGSENEEIEENIEKKALRKKPNVILDSDSDDEVSEQSKIEDEAKLTAKSNSKKKKREETNSQNFEHENQISTAIKLPKGSKEKITAVQKSKPSLQEIEVIIEPSKRTSKRLSSSSDVNNLEIPVDDSQNDAITDNQKVHEYPKNAKLRGRTRKLEQAEVFEIREPKKLDNIFTKPITHEEEWSDAKKAPKYEIENFSDEDFVSSKGKKTRRLPKKDHNPVIEVEFDDNLTITMKKNENKILENVKVDERKPITRNRKRVSDVEIPKPIKKGRVGASKAVKEALALKKLEESPSDTDIIIMNADNEENSCSENLHREEIINDNNLIINDLDTEKEELEIDAGGTQAKENIKNSTQNALSLLENISVNRDPEIEYRALLSLPSKNIVEKPLKKQQLEKSKSVRGKKTIVKDSVFKAESNDSILTTPIEADIDLTEIKNSEIYLTTSNTSISIKTPSNPNFPTPNITTNNFYKENGKNSKLSNENEQERTRAKRSKKAMKVDSVKKLNKAEDMELVAEKNFESNFDVDDEKFEALDYDPKKMVAPSVVKNSKATNKISKKSENSDDADNNFEKNKFINPNISDESTAELEINYIENHVEQPFEGKLKNRGRAAKTVKTSNKIMAAKSTSEIGKKNVENKTENLDIDASLSEFFDTEHIDKKNERLTRGTKKLVLNGIDVEADKVEYNLMNESAPQPSKNGEDNQNNHSNESIFIEHAKEPGPKRNVRVPKPKITKNETTNNINGNHQSEMVLITAPTEETDETKKRGRTVKTTKVTNVSNPESNSTQEFDNISQLNHTYIEITTDKTEKMKIVSKPVEKKTRNKKTAKEQKIALAKPQISKTTENSFEENRNELERSTSITFSNSTEPNENESNKQDSTHQLSISKIDPKVLLWMNNVSRLGNDRLADATLGEFIETVFVKSQEDLQDIGKKIIKSLEESFNKVKTDIESM
ncbi:hypothetical protein HK096_010890 [Nowakowskiella sp. JEL0078]|nr:hypothetical protein HK096_010890 [Nowakowskiella sp. JEL0078]